MRLTLFFVALLLFVKNNYSDDFPWKNILYIRIRIELNDSPRLSASHDYCHCNCDSGKSIGCNYDSFKFRSWDKDTCFWINLFNTSNPKLKERGPVLILGCGPPSRTVEIEIETKQNDFLIMHFDGITPKILKMHIKKDLNIEWNFELNEYQLNLLNNKIDMLIKCGINDLQNKIYDKACGCN